MLSRNLWQKCRLLPSGHEKNKCRGQKPERELDSKFSAYGHIIVSSVERNDTEIAEEKCAELELPLYKVERANHSLETADPMEDLSNLKWIMEKVKDFWLIKE